MDNNCMLCGSKTDNLNFPYLTVQTLHIRDLGGEKRVQALGEKGEASICKACAEQRLAELSDTKDLLTKRLLPFVIMFIIGVVLSILFYGKDRAFFMLGLAAAACGVMGCYSRLRVASAKKKDYEKLSGEDALMQAAWEALSDALPKKDEDNDLTYIPITPKTLALKNGDLMIVYNLLPDIAKKAWNIIHGKEEA